VLSFIKSIRIALRRDHSHKVVYTSMKLSRLEAAKEPDAIKNLIQNLW
jgi:hypothetical protein